MKEGTKLAIALGGMAVVIFGLIFAWAWFMASRPSIAIGTVSIDPNAPAVVDPVCRSSPRKEISLGDGTFERTDTRLIFGFEDDLADDWTVALARPDRERVDFTRRDCSVFDIDLSYTGDEIMGIPAIAGSISLQCQKDGETLSVSLSELYCHHP